MELTEIELKDNIRLNFLAPYDKFLSDKTFYTVTEVATLQTLVDNGINPKSSIYASYGIEDDYDKDLQNNVPIIELTLGLIKHYIPLNKIASKNTINTIKYSERLIGINLGQLPSDEKIDTLLTDIDLLVQARLGIKAGVDQKVINDSIAVDKPDHDKQEAKRTAIRTQKGNYRTLYYQLSRKYQLIVEKLRALETAYRNQKL